jgi:predicted transcriptional regulator
MTTVVTTLERLHAKGILHRGERHGVYFYIATMDRAAFEEQIVTRVMEGLLADFRQPALSYLADQLALEESELTGLERDLRQRRREEQHDA